MSKNTLVKIIVLNLLISFVNIFLFSNAFLSLDISGTAALDTAFGYTAIIMSVVVFFYGNYKIITAKPKLLKAAEIKSINDCFGAIEQNMGKKTFSKNLETAQLQIKRFIKKKNTIKEILLEKFHETEMSYVNFTAALDELEKVMYQNVKSLLNRISAFDQEEYNQIQRNPTMKLRSTKLDIYNEYISFAEDAVEDNEQIILKLDKLLLEISKFNSLEDGELENMSAMKEIDELIKNAKLYK